MPARFSGVVVIGVTVVAACFSPSYDRPTCGPAGECPGGMICDSQGACESLPDTCRAFGLKCSAGQICAVNQAICVDVGGCGDGIVEVGEVCDDGNTVDGMPDPDNPSALILDQCSHDCHSTQVCGNGVVDAGEQCDDGSDNGSPTGTCDIKCRKVSRVCGNGAVDSGTGEECDPGLMDSAGCNGRTAGPVACKAARCGDGYLNTAAGEQCESGGTDTQTCNGTAAGSGRACHAPVCGDGYINLAAGEECESNGQNTQTCNGSAAGMRACRSPSCGDGYVNTAFIPSGGSAPEECDNAFGADSMTCNGNSGGRNGPGACRKPACGDGYTNTMTGEQCDTLGGGDSATCNGIGAGAVKCRMSACGDNYLNTSAGEQCEINAPCPASKICTNFCKCI